MDERNLISRESFLAAHVVAFPKHEDVEVPGLGTVKVKAMNAGERDAFESANSEAKAKDFRARVVAATCITEQGALMFGPEDIPRLTLFDPAMLDPIVRAAVRINRFTAEDQEDLKKNSNGQVLDSSSDSPAILENHSAK